MDFIGSIFGYLLWGLYSIFKNYGIAIILFTVIVKLITFPLNIKQQKSMAAQSKMAAKQKEIQGRYPNDRQKQNEELQKLYDKEGASPTAGCLPMLLPLLVMFGIMYSVINPLTNTLHIDRAHVDSAIAYVERIPGVASGGIYKQHEIIRNYQELKPELSEFFTADEIAKIESFSGGFDFLGLDLLKAPRDGGFSVMLIIPILSFAVNMLTQFFQNKSNPAMQAQQQQGCMKVTLYLLPLLSVYYAYIMPGALGIYWVVNGITGFIQIVITNQFFSVRHMTAKQEAMRAVTMELFEQKLQPLPESVQMENARYLAGQPQTTGQKQKQKNNGSKKKQQNRNQQNNSSQYQGNKK